MTNEQLQELNATAAETVAWLTLITTAADNAADAMERLAEAQAKVSL